MSDPMAASAEGSSSKTTVSHNVLSLAHTLLLSSVPPATHLNHPYAPSTLYGSWKGKAREGSQGVGLDEQERMLKMLKEGLEAGKAVVQEAAKGDRSTKLARAMRDVVTHQSASLPLIPSLSPDQSRPPSYRTSLPPIQLLEAISQRLGIETYLEESQFGLLKTTLAIAGKRFVLDVDLEVDSATGAENEDDDPPSSAPLATPSTTINLETGDTRRGRVRLTKLFVNHVTKDGGTAKSDSIGLALKDIVEEYIEFWNGDRLPTEGERLVKRLWDEMGDLAGLDRMAEESGTDWFLELEQMASLVKGLVDEGVVREAGRSILPSFGLLPEMGELPSQSLFHLRPAAVHEGIGNPLNPAQAGCDWIIEYKPDDLAGLVVRRNWLMSSKGDTHMQSEGVTVEQLLYNGSHGEGTFPYSKTFLHPKSGSDDHNLEQQWTMLQSGPAGYLVGRCGFGSADDLRPILDVLTRQAKLDVMVGSVLDPRALVPAENMESEEIDDDADFEMLSQPSASLPITMKLVQYSLTASMPLPHSTEVLPPTLEISFRPVKDSLSLDIQWTMSTTPDDAMRARVEEAVEKGKTVGLNVVRALTAIEQSLSPSHA